MRFQFCLAMSIAGASLLFGAGARADVIYPTRAAFLANSSGDTTLDFGALTAGQPFVSYPTGSGPTVSQLVFSTSALLPDPATPQILFALAPNTAFNPSSEGLLASESPLSVNAPMDLLITIPSGVTAIGFDLGSGSGNPLTITLSDGTVDVVTTPAGAFSPGFIGFTAPVGITSLHVTSPLESFITAGNLVFGTAVPEPISLNLLAVGGLGLLARRRA